MKRITFFLLSVVGSLMLFQAESFACHCSLPPSKKSLAKQVQKARRESQAVFSGRVLEVRENPQVQYVVVKFRVDNSWKGDVPEEVTVMTGHGGGDCGYRFEVGESYLVYAYTSDTHGLETNICQRTAKLSEATADIKVGSLVVKHISLGAKLLTWKS